MSDHFFNKVAGLRPATLLKKNFVKFLRTHFYIEHLIGGCFCVIESSFVVHPSGKYSSEDNLPENVKPLA